MVRHVRFSLIKSTHRIIRACHTAVNGCGVPCRARLGCRGRKLRGTAGNVMHFQAWDYVMGICTIAHRLSHVQIATAAVRQAEAPYVSLDATPVWMPPTPQPCGYGYVIIHTYIHTTQCRASADALIGARRSAWGGAASARAAHVLRMCCARSMPRCTDAAHRGMTLRCAPGHA